MNQMSRLEVTVYLGISKSRFYKLIDKGIIKPSIDRILRGNRACAHAWSVEYIESIAPKVAEYIQASKRGEVESLHPDYIKLNQKSEDHLNTVFREFLGSKQRHRAYE